jgi:hypothetical protein
MSLSARVTYDKVLDSYDVAFDFNKYGGDYETLQAVIKVIKSSVAVSNREYNAETKHWSFTHIAFRNIVEKMFVAMHIPFTITETIETKTVGPDNFFYEHAVTQQIPESSNIICAKLMKLLGVTEETLKDTNALKKVYRAKAREFHPDLGGDADKMSELNRLWTLFNEVSI